MRGSPAAIPDTTLLRGGDVPIIRRHGGTI
jgi:hypothetical protein